MRDEFEPALTWRFFMRLAAEQLHPHDPGSQTLGVGLGSPVEVVNVRVVLLPLHVVRIVSQVVVVVMRTVYDLPEYEVESTIVLL